MIIEVKQPAFLLDKNNHEKVSYSNEIGDNWTSIMVGTYQFGFPKLKEGEILYKYSANRGYITNYVTHNILLKDGDIEYEYTKLGGNILVGLRYKGDGDAVIELDKFITNKFGNAKYTEFIDMNMDNPWVRIIIIGDYHKFLFGL